MFGQGFKDVGFGLTQSCQTVEAAALLKWMPLTVRLSVDWDPTDLMGLITSLTFNGNKKQGIKRPEEISAEIPPCTSVRPHIHPRTMNAHVNNTHPRTLTHMVWINITDTRHKSLKIFSFMSPTRAQAGCVNCTPFGNRYKFGLGYVWTLKRPIQNYTSILHLTLSMTSTNCHEIP